MEILRKMSIKSSWEELKNAADHGTWHWWLRSPYPYSGTFCRVNTDGTVHYDLADFSIGAAPAFCIE